MRLLWPPPATTTSALGVMLDLVPLLFLGLLPVEQVGGVSGRDGRLGRAFQARRTQRRQRVGVAHVERIVAAQHHLLGPYVSDQLAQPPSVVGDRVEEEAPDRLERRLLQARPRLRLKGMSMGQPTAKRG